MTTMKVVDNHDETRTEAVARRLRGQLAERRISVLALANMAGYSQSTLSRRMTGEIAFKIDELDTICSVAGIDFGYVTTGKRQSPHPDDDPDGGLTVRRRGLEPRTRWLRTQHLQAVA